MYLGFTKGKCLFYISLKSVKLPKEEGRSRKIEDRIYLNVLEWDYYKFNGEYKKHISEIYIEKSLIGHEARIISTSLIKISNPDINPDILEDALVIQLPEKIIV